MTHAVFFFRVLPVHRTFFRSLVITLLLFLLPASILLAQGTVKGRLKGDPSKGSLKGATVMLFQYSLGKNGQPEQPKPIGRMTAGEKGVYEFKKVPIKARSLYQLGTRVDGRLVASRFFMFTKGKTLVEFDFPLPELVEDLTGLRLAQVLLAFDPGISAVWVTEVFHFVNTTKNTLATGEKPVNLPIPGGVEEFKILKMGLQKGKHTQIGGKVMVFGEFPPGQTTVAYRYRSQARLGHLNVEKKYPFPINQVLSLTPKNTLSVEGAEFKPMEEKNIDGTRYQASARGKLTADTPFSLSISGIRVHQGYFLVPLGVFLLGMIGIIFWFLRVRLKREIPA